MAFSGLSIISRVPKLRFVDHRNLFFALSTVLIVGALALFAVRGLNYGIDFQGGIVIEVRTPAPGQIGQLRDTLSGLGLGEVALQEFGAPDDILIRVQKQPGGDEAQQAAVNLVKTTLGDGLEYRRTEFVGPKVSEELFLDGVLAVAAALIAILAYIWFRFEWQFGLGAVVALIHDVLATVGVFALTGLEFNLSTVAAVLTIAGYSINDTVVVFDRVRENLRKYKSMSLPELLNNSINETLSRTVMTSLTTLVALLSLYILGGEVIRGFSFAMIWGVVVGTYSSVCVAVPLLLYLGVRRNTAAEEAAKEKESGSPEKA
jgi:preprotein translocase subunit SecF